MRNDREWNGVNWLLSEEMPNHRQLMRTAERMTDAELKSDFLDCVLPLAPSAESKNALNTYYLRRVRAKDFRPGTRGANNHSG